MSECGAQPDRHADRVGARSVCSSQVLSAQMSLISFTLHRPTPRSEGQTHSSVRSAGITRNEVGGALLCPHPALYEFHYKFPRRRSPLIERFPCSIAALSSSRVLGPPALVHVFQHRGGMIVPGVPIPLESGTRTSDALPRLLQLHARPKHSKRLFG